MTDRKAPSLSAVIALLLATLFCAGMTFVSAKPLMQTHLQFGTATAIVCHKNAKSCSGQWSGDDGKILSNIVIENTTVSGTSEKAIFENGKKIAGLPAVAPLNHVITHSLLWLLVTVIGAVATGVVWVSRKDALNSIQN